MHFETFGSHSAENMNLCKQAVEQYMIPDLANIVQDMLGSNTVMNETESSLFYGQVFNVKGFEDLYRTNRTYWFGRIQLHVSQYSVTPTACKTWITVTSPWSTRTRKLYNMSARDALRLMDLQVEFYEPIRRYQLYDLCQELGLSYKVMLPVFNQTSLESTLRCFMESQMGRRATLEELMSATPSQWLITNTSLDTRTRLKSIMRHHMNLYLEICVKRKQSLR